MAYTDIRGRQVAVSHLSEYMDGDGTWVRQDGKRSITRDLIVGAVDYAGENDTSTIRRVETVLNPHINGIAQPPTTKATLMDWSAAAGRHVARIGAAVAAQVVTPAPAPTEGFLGDWDEFSARIGRPVWTTVNTDLAVADYTATYSRYVVATAFASDITAYSATVSYQLTGGALPPGWSLDGATGEIAGTVAGGVYPAGAYGFSVEAVASGVNAAASASALRTFALTINTAAVPVFTTTQADVDVLNSGGPTSVVVGAGSASVELVGSGATGLPTGVVGYDLPAELSWDANTKTLSGDIAGTVGDYQITFRAVAQEAGKEEGVSYVTFLVKQYIGTLGNPATSSDAIRAAAEPTGTYYMATPAGPVPVHVDNDRAGGGWMLLTSLNRGYVANNAFANDHNRTDTRDMFNSEYNIAPANFSATGEDMDVFTEVLYNGVWRRIGAYWRGVPMSALWSNSANGNVACTASVSGDGVNFTGNLTTCIASNGWTITYSSDVSGDIHQYFSSDISTAGMILHESAGNNIDGLYGPIEGVGPANYDTNWTRVRIWYRTY